MVEQRPLFPFYKVIVIIALIITIIPFLWTFLTSLKTYKDIMLGSFSFTPELVYTGIHNTEARFRLAWLQGEANTEFGEKLSDYRAELRLRHVF